MNFKTKIKKSSFQMELKANFKADITFDLKLSKKLENDRVVKEAAELLKKGEIVALPTETVYGLAADALNPEAVKKIFTAKGRPQDNPLIVHISRRSQLKELTAEIPKKAEKLMERFWPGPLTIIFSKSSKVPDRTSGGLDTVAVRMPAHPLMMAVMEKSKLALAAPSANTSGFPSPTRAEHVFSDLEGKIPLILDGGPCYLGVESTVLDVRGGTVKVLRPGGISRKQLSSFLGEKIELAAELKAGDKKVRSPGMKYRHYAPDKKLYVFNFDDKFYVLKKALKKAEDKRIALITAEESDIEIPAAKTANIKRINAFSHQKPEKLAQKLFDLLRRLDADQSVEEIYIEEVDSAGMGEAVMNRVYKAAAAEKDFQPGGGNN